MHARRFVGWPDPGPGGKLMARTRIALISNPKSTGNLAQLPRIRAFCAAHPDIFHYEVECADQIGEALQVIDRIGPAVLAINGGDGTVQAALTELISNGKYRELLEKYGVAGSAVETAKINAGS